MNNMYPVVLFLVVFTITSSSVCVSSDNDADQEILMVVDDQPTTMHDIDAGIGMTKADPFETGKFIMEDGKVLTLSRKSTPSRNCIHQDQPCGLLDWCCNGLTCDGAFDGRCHPTGCSDRGEGCFSRKCCSPYECIALVCSPFPW